MVIIHGNRAGSGIRDVGKILLASILKGRGAKFQRNNLRNTSLTYANHEVVKSSFSTSRKLAFRATFRATLIFPGSLCPRKMALIAQEAG